MRGCFLMKVYLIAIYNCPMIVGYFLMYLFLIDLFDFEWTYAIFNPRKTYKTRDSVFSQRLTTMSLMMHLMMQSTWPHLAAQKSFIRKTSKKFKNSWIFKNIWKKINIFRHSKVRSIILISQKMISEHRKNFEKFSEFSLNMMEIVIWLLFEF